MDMNAIEADSVVNLHQASPYFFWYSENWWKGRRKQQREVERRDLW